MNASEEHARFAEDVGAYLLGALDPREEQAFEDHLDTCHLCQEEVAQLTVARDALPRAVPQLQPPPELKASLMATVESEAAARHEMLAPAAATRRVRRGGWRERLLARPSWAAAAAALLLFVGVAAGALVGTIGGGSGDDVRTVGAQVDTQRVAAQATAQLVIDDDQNTAHLHVTGMPLPVEKDVYEVWVKHGDRVTPASLFEVNQDGDGVASVPDLEGADAVLVTREKRGGVDQPTEDPVVSIDL